MAISVGATTRIPRGVRMKLVPITLDNSYPTGGYAITAANIGVSKIRHVRPQLLTSGYVPIWDATNSKLMLRWSGGSGAVLSEVTAATDVSAVTVTLEVWGSA